MPTYLPVDSRIPVISATGISSIQFADLEYSILTDYLSTYGLDTSQDVSTQDMTDITARARATYDVGQGMIAAYNSFRPSGAQGAGLSTNVKINGIARLVSSQSSVVASIVGQAGTIITNGITKDAAANQWTLPTPVTIPVGGQISETLTCQTQGSIALASGVALTIFTPTPGWQTVATTSAAIPGAPVETDAALRLRQTQSTALPALTVMQSLIGNIANLSGVIAVQGYENDTGVTNALGIPPHSIAMVVEGGSVAAIAQVIANDKAPGAYTYGNTSYIVTNSQGLPQTINYFVDSVVQIYAVTTVNPLPGYVSTTSTAILTAQAAYINGLVIGQPLYKGKLDSVANLYGDAATASSAQTQSALDALSETYTLTSNYLARGDMTVTTAVASGATSLTLGNVASLSAGQLILITDGTASTEPNTIAGISGNTLTLATGTTNAIAPGSLVYVYGSLTAAFYEQFQTAVANLTLAT